MTIDRNTREILHAAEVDLEGIDLLQLLFLQSECVPVCDSTGVVLDGRVRRFRIGHQLVENRRRRGSKAGFEGKSPWTFNRQDRRLPLECDREILIRILADDDEHRVIFLHAQREEPISVRRGRSIHLAHLPRCGIQNPRISLPTPQ